MKEKKTSAEWYIAATHWLTAGFVMPLILGFILAFVIGLLVGSNPSLAGGVMAYLPIVYVPLMFWAGVAYSARYVNKTYIITNAKKVVILSTVYLAVLGGGFRVLGLLSTGLFSTEYVGFIIGVILFYFMSKKYIKNTSEASQA